MYLLALASLLSTASAIWPRPEQLSHGDSVLWLSKDVEFQCRSSQRSMFQSVLGFLGRNENGLPSAAHVCSETVLAAVERARTTILEQSFIPWMLHRRGSQFEPLDEEDKRYISSVDIFVPPEPCVERFNMGVVDESYSVSVTKTGRFQIKAKSSIGVIRAMDTVTQLFFKHSECGACAYMTMAPLEIEDKPRFSHRAVNLDVARNWYPLSDILRTVDIMAWNKFNRLHLHVTDSQAWPLEVPALPELAREGAYYKGLTYSPQDIQQLQSFAALRGIEVVLEVDMPGHTASIAHAYPDLITALDMQPEWKKYAYEPPSGQLKLNSPAVDRFVERLLEDLLPRLKGHSTFFHTGGDEVNLQSYLLDETVQSNDREVIKPLLQKFIDRLHDRIRAHGLTPVVWEEMLLVWDLALGSDVVVQSWRSKKAVAEIVRRGRRVIAGNYQHWYLDCGHGQWLIPRSPSPGSSASSSASASASGFGSGSNDTAVTAPPGNDFRDYCSPYKPWQEVYSHDPVAGVDEERRVQVLGAEVHMWSELTDDANLDGKLWPRASAAAEVLWYGQERLLDADAHGHAHAHGRSSGESSIAFASVTRRLAEWRQRMVARGVAAEVVQMAWCTQAGPSSCSMDMTRKPGGA